MELAHMVKCVKDNEERTMICPIFYDVTPSEVRNQTGEYEKAFDLHKKNKDLKTETVDQWREALKNVPDTKGWECAKISDGYEGDLVKKVGTKVLAELKKKHVKVTTEHLVGMDHHEEKLMKLLDLDCNDVRIVGIVGMGGLGKTTIARVVFNKLCDGFSQHCCFLEDVRESEKKSGGLDNLKKKLMADVLKRTSEGMEMNQGTFKDTKALIVVDDVEDRKQLVKIIGECGWYGPGSRIIVTTRKRDTFNEEGRERTYEPPVMNFNNALLLFCKHAFRQDIPREGYEDLSKEVVKKVAGLPLSLEVIGSLLSTKKRKEWKEILEELKQLVMPDIHKSLKISYDMLDDGQKEIFLDIACHFINSPEDETIAAKYMWTDCGFSPALGIEALVTLSLVKFNEYNNFGMHEQRFWMHDQLRDLGREIVKKQNLSDPGVRSRLWSDEEALLALTNRRATKRVETLDLRSNPREDYCLSNEEFKGPSRLRCLFLNKRCNLKGDFSGMLSNLRWFRWQIFSPSQIKVTNLCLPKLAVLDLSSSNIKDGWEEHIQIERATNLKLLNLLGCYMLTKTPDLSAFSKLERLNLCYCRNLVKIQCPSAKHLRHLKYLNLNGCGKCCEEDVPDGTSSSESMRRKLPEFIWNLKSLVELHMEGVPITELSEAIKNLTNLRTLDVSYTRIKKLPNDAFGKLEKLEKLNASECISLEELPESIGNLQNLRLLKMRCSGIKRLPSAIEGLNKLEELDVASCKSLEELPETLGKLRSLILLKMRCSGIKRLPSAIEGLNKLEELDVEFCESLEELPETLGKLRSLKLLKMSYSGIKRLPSAIEGLNKLEELDVEGCKSLEELPETLGELRSLKLLKMSYSGIKRLPSAIKGLDKLEELYVSHCKSLEELPGTLGELRSLKLLKMRHSGIKGLRSAIGRLDKLEELDVENCTSLRKIPKSIGNLQNLRWLNISGCKVKRLPSTIGWLGKLEILRATECKLLGELPESIRNLKNLQLLDLESSGIKKLPMEMLQKLEQIDCIQSSFEGELSSAVWGLSAISCCSNLKTLNLGRCSDLRLRSSEDLKLPLGLVDVEIPLTKASLESVSSLPKLKRLIFHRCEDTDNLEEFTMDLARLPPELTGFSLYGFENYTSSVPIKINNLSWLQSLYIRRTEDDDVKIDTDKRWLEFQGSEILWERLPDLPNSLEKLYIKNCPFLESLPDLSALQGLDILHIEGCEKLRQITGLESLTRLKKLRVLCGNDTPIPYRFLESETYISYTNLPVRINNLLWLRSLYIGIWDDKYYAYDDDDDDDVDVDEGSLVMVCGGKMLLERLPDLPTSLEKIIIYNCPELCDVEGLAAGGLTSLTKLSIIKCRSLKGLPDFSTLQGLTELKIDNCRSLESLPNLSTLQRLKDLEICRCEKLRQIRGLESLTRLVYLALGNCPSLEKLPDLSHLEQEYGFEIDNCGPENGW